jgi:serine/threonine protein kinase
MSSKSTLKKRIVTSKAKNTALSLKKVVVNPFAKGGKKYDLSQLIFRESDIVGEGTYAKVYKFRYKDKDKATKIDDKYVVKKIKVLFLRKYYGKTDIANKILFDTFTEEVNALIDLSKLNISPKVYGIYVDLEHNSMFYVMQRLDYSLGEIMRKNMFRIEHVYMFLNLLDTLLKTKYRHTDLHIDNVLFDESTSQFYLIDFGKLRILSKKDSEDYYYTQKNSSKDVGFIDFSKPIDRAILGSSKYSAIATIYKFLAYFILTNEEDIEAQECLKFLKSYIKKIVPNKQYKGVIEVLDKNV